MTDTNAMDNLKAKLRQAHPDAPLLNMIVVKSVPLKNPSQDFGATLDDTMFLQTQDFDRCVFNRLIPNWWGSRAVVVDDFYVTGCHECGHALGLSTRFANLPIGNKLRKHDQGIPPWDYGIDGVPVHKNAVALDNGWWSFLKFVPWKDSTLTVTIPGIGSVIDKRRAEFPLMGQSEEYSGEMPEFPAGQSKVRAAGALPGNSFRSLWIRHEDWRPANNGAARFEFQDPAP